MFHTDRFQLKVGSDMHMCLNFRLAILMTCASTNICIYTLNKQYLYIYIHFFTFLSISVFCKHIAAKKQRKESNMCTSYALCFLQGGTEKGGASDGSAKRR